MNFFALLPDNKKPIKGFGLVETLVSVAVFLLISVAIYGGFTKTLQAVQVLKVKNAATNLVNEQIEIVRNLPYVDVGIVGGIPEGKVLREQTLNREGIEFNVTTSIRDIDDPFDGRIGQEPNDLSPADYKLVEFNIKCQNCVYPEEMTYYTRVAPLALETQGNNGALFIRVFDANGQPVSGADVLIENNTLEEPISISEVTDNLGMFQIVDAPTSTQSYAVTVNKNGYSEDKTYMPDDPSNPDPNRPHANVVTGEVTQLSFYIDELSNLEINTHRNSCQNISNVNFNMKGSKTVGQGVLKTDSNYSTDSTGNVLISDVEWDSYNFEIIDNWDLLGTSPVLPVEINPNSEQVIDLILTNKEPNSFQVSIVDSETNLPISNAEITLSDGSNENTLTTGLGFITQTDWSGGPGQEFMSFDNDRYFEDDGNIDYANGDLKLAEFDGGYVNSGFLESSVFDIGIESNFGHIFWNPINQPTETGNESVKFQIATNKILNATTTWDFVGPDGTGATYYTDSGQEISNIHSGDRYLKYQVFLSTQDISKTPIISNISFTLMTDCVPPGQVLFQNLNTGEYSIEVKHPDYQDYLLDGYDLNQDWQTQKVEMIPN